MDREDLTRIAAKVLNEKGQEIVEEYLDEGHTDYAKICILGAIDRTVEDGHITDEAAAQLYQELGLPAERIRQIRQRHASVRFN